MEEEQEEEGEEEQEEEEEEARPHLLDLPGVVVWENIMERMEEGALQGAEAEGGRVLGRGGRSSGTRRPGTRRRTRRLSLS